MKNTKLLKRLNKYKNGKLMSYKLFDDSGNVIRYKSKKSDEKYEYDENGKLIRIFYKNDKTANYEYDENGNKIAYSNSDGINKIYKYDEFNRLIYSETLNDSYKNYEYDESGNLVHIKTMFINKTEDNEIDAYIDYDDRGNPIHFKETTGREMWEQYDQNNNLIYTKINNKEETLKETWYYYNQTNDLIYIKDSKGGKESFKYDKEGDRIKSKNNSGIEKVYIYE